MQRYAPAIDNRYRWTNGLSALAALALCSMLVAMPARAGDDSDSDSDDSDGGQFCSATAELQRSACDHEVRDDHFTARAICLNLADDEEREECFDDAAADRRAARRECREQEEARLELCEMLGEDRYDPDFGPDLFDDDFENPANPNPYYPLIIGYQWSYSSDDETNTRLVLDETKLIEGVTCIVLNDLVLVDGVAKEDTDDWFGQRLDGTIDYCGEEVKDFELFPGDDPQLPELVAIDGSFKVGRDGDKSGTIFLAAPQVGDVYRQEFSAGNAEDAAFIISTTYGYGDDSELDELVPQDLAELLCPATDCIVTGDVVPLEPGVFERKYYARDIGLFLEVNVEEGGVNQLVGCNFDPRCTALPAP